jgi:hypothetical protein
MSMSKKDYLNIAAIFKAEYNSTKVLNTVRTLDRVLRSMMDMMSRGNEQFDRDRFLAAAVPRWHRAAFDLTEAPVPTLMDGLP